MSGTTVDFQKRLDARRKADREFDAEAANPLLIEFNSMRDEESFARDETVVVGLSGSTVEHYRIFLANVRPTHDGRFSGDIIWFIPFDQRLEWPADQIHFDKKHVQKRLKSHEAAAYIAESVLDAVRNGRAP